jgi:hypothetical protein
MRLEFRLRYVDRFLFNACHQFLSPIINGFFIALAVLALVGELGNRSVSGAVVVALTFYVAMWLIQLLFLSLLLLTRKSDSILAGHVFEVRDEGVCDTTEYHQSRVFWKGIKRVVSRPGLVAIYVAQHSAMLVPKRAFPSKDAVRQFIESIRDRLAAR